MKTIRHYGLFLIIQIILIAVACEKGSATSQEMREIEHFKRAQTSFLEASRYLKKLTKGNNLIVSMSESERNTYIKMLMEALTDAKSVSASTLAKIHPELPSAYRSIFIPCLEYKLRGFRDYDPKASIEGTELHNKWIDWWNAHYKKFTKI